MQTTHTTRILTEALNDALPPRQRHVLAAIVVVLTLASIGGALMNVRPATPHPIVIVATAQPLTARVAQSQPTPVQVRYVVAFDAPSGNVLGPIPEPAAFTARYGDGWLMTQWNGGPAWVRTTDLTNAPAQLADLKPTEAPPVQVIVVAAPAPAMNTAVVPTPEPSFYDTSTLPTPAPWLIAACASPAGQRSWICGGSAAQPAVSAQQVR